MLRVYLDQNKWIALSRAKHGYEQEAAAYRDILDVTEAAVQFGLASFPLSSLHYVELIRHADPGARWRLATFMAGVSRFHTIAPANVLLEKEIDEALRKRFGVPTHVREHPVFGLGFGHASGEPDAGFWAGIRGRVDTADDWFNWERLILGRPPIEGIDLNEGIQAMRIPSEEYRNLEQTLSASFQRMQVEQEHMRGILTGFELMDMKEPLLTATRRAGLPDAALTGLEKDALTAFVRELPTRDVPLAIRQLRHQNYEEVWDPNDLPDMGAMAVAIPYCDVVVTERKFAHLVRRAGLDSRYETTILTDLSDLREPLIAGSVD